MTRRTPALTTRVRELFADAVASGGWTPGATVPAIAEEVGLTAEQVRDAIFGPAADEWRRALVDQLRRSEVNASS